VAGVEQGERTAVDIRKIAETFRSELAKATETGALPTGPTYAVRAVTRSKIGPQVSIKIERYADLIPGGGQDDDARQQWRDHDAPLLIAQVDAVTRERWTPAIPGLTSFGDLFLSATFTGAYVIEPTSSETGAAE
jgi:hypothetical protein